MHAISDDTLDSIVCTKNILNILWIADVTRHGDNNGHDHMSVDSSYSHLMYTCIVPHLLCYGYINGLYDCSRVFSSTSI